MLKFSHTEKHALEDLVRNIGKLSLGGLFIISTVWAAQAHAATVPVSSPTHPISIQSPH